MGYKEKVTSLFYHTGNRIISVAGSVIFFFLCWYSFRYTQYMPPFSLEFPVNVADSMLRNLLALGLLAAMTVGLTAAERKLEPKVQRVISTVLSLLMVSWILFASLWWIGSAERVPGSDQLYVCNDASAFMQDIYLSLEPGYYCDKYPQQLGLIALLEVLFSIVGPYNFFAVEVVCAFMAPCIAFFGYRIVREVTESLTASVLYCVMMTCCLPLVFYTSWVYGEIPGVFFSFLAVMLAFRYANRKHWLYLVGTVAAFSLAVLVRKNSIILAVAFGLAAFLYALRKKDRKLLVTALCAVLVPCVAFWGIQEMYEIRSGVEKSSGIPSTAGISLGLQEKDGRYGWDWGYEGEVYADCGNDKEKADAVYRQDISERLKVFADQPAYAVHFFKEKQLSQWNAPLYQSYYFSQNYSPENPPAQDSLTNRLSTEYFGLLLFVCDRLQFVLYVGMLLYFLLAVRKDSDMLQHVLAVMVIGGFFFSMIWEAKARYIMPYYMGMFPVAALGYRQSVLWCRKVWDRYRDCRAEGMKTSEADPAKETGDAQDNIIPFQKKR